VALTGVDAVINAAGIADAAGNDDAAIFGANALRPELVRRAVGWGVRFVHISSAGAQGTGGPLDKTVTHRTFSMSHAVERSRGASALSQADVVIYRPTSVQGRSGPIKRTLVKFARSPLASVAGVETERRRRRLRAERAEGFGGRAGLAVGVRPTCRRDPPC